MSFAREGLVFIFIAIALAAIAWAAAATYPSTLLAVLAVLFTVVAIWVGYFFRDPERTGVRSANAVISPADGRVVLISEVDEPSFLHGRATRVSIFMSIFNVHVNRYPVSGVVAYLHYNRGKFVNAAADKASLDNEQMSTGIETNGRRVMVRQIAGLIARRIVNYSREGDRVDQGQRMGLIRFGSRVDVFLPVGSRINVKVGDRTAAGTTVVGELSA